MSTVSSEVDDTSSTGNTGYIIGGVFGGLTFVVLACVACVILYRRFWKSCRSEKEKDREQRPVPPRDYLASDGEYGEITSEYSKHIKQGPAVLQVESSVHVQQNEYMNHKQINKRETVITSATMKPLNDISYINNNFEDDDGLTYEDVENIKRENSYVNTNKIKDQIVQRNQVEESESSVLSGNDATDGELYLNCKEVTTQQQPKTETNANNLEERDELEDGSQESYYSAAVKLPFQNTNPHTPSTQSGIIKHSRPSDGPTITGLADPSNTTDHDYEITNYEANQAMYFELEKEEDLSSVSSLDEDEYGYSLGQMSKNV